LSQQILRAGEWFLRSGIQQPDGGVARYYRADEARNVPVSTEITAYAISAFVYLHTVTRDQRYLDAASRAAAFLVEARDLFSGCVPFELDGKDLAYFFDSGIVVRGLLSAWRALGDRQFLAAATAVGESMLKGGFDAGADFHPILDYGEMRPAVRNPLRWSQSSGCYQLKAALAWWDLAGATGDETFRKQYARVLDYSLRTWSTFLPGHPERAKVMDRLHAFLYFLEGLLPRATEMRCTVALCEGMRRAGALVRDIAPEFIRSDVYAQLLRVRLYADCAGVAPLDREAAAFEAGQLAGFQAADPDPRIEGGYWFGRAGQTWLPFVNPVSTAFAMQALEMWRQSQSGGATAVLDLLI
jgi:hypothetical protein